MKPFKAPGPDGLHASFFQKCWKVVSASVTKANLDVFNSGTMPAELNQTLITLIPKRKGLETLNHFRLISLYNTVYKIVTKFWC